MEYKFSNGYEYVHSQIKDGRWDLDSDTFDIVTALEDAWEEGREQGLTENNLQCF